MKKAITIIAICLMSNVASADIKVPDWWTDESTTLKRHLEWNFETEPEDGWECYPSCPESVGDGEHQLSKYPDNEIFRDIITLTSYLDPFEWWGGWVINRSDETQQISVNILNYVDDYPYKDIFVSICFTSPTEESPSINAIYSREYDQDTGEKTDLKVNWSFNDDVTVTNGSYTEGRYSFIWEQWTITPNPDYEDVVIDVPAGCSIYNVDVYTRSYVPEPATLALLAAGGLILKRRVQ